MLKVFALRLVRLLATLLAVSILTFMLGVFLPGDPINAILPPDSPRDPATVQRLTEELGLDDPTPVRYLRWLGDAVQGDLGYSYVNDQPVLGTILDRVPVTGELAILATLIALAVAVPTGIIGGYREGRPVDRISSAGVQIGLSVPSFIAGLTFIWLFTVRDHPERSGGMLLIWLIFAVIGGALFYAFSRLESPAVGTNAGLAIAAIGGLVTLLSWVGVFGLARVGLMALVMGLALYWGPEKYYDNSDLYKVIASWVVAAGMAALFIKIFTTDLDLPSTGWQRVSNGIGANLKSAILPAMALSLSPMAFYTRLLRSDMIGTLKEDFVLSARAKGLTDRYILGRHALRPSSLSLVTIIGIQIGILLGGTVVIEEIFALPGLGRRLLEAINQRDILMVQGITVFIATVYVLINTFVDFIYMAIDPRIRKR